MPDYSNPQSLNRYAYCLNNPLIYTDSSGNFFETIWDLYSVGSGAYSMTKNIMKGNWVDASIDAGGVVLDMGAAIVPFVPAVGSTSIKAGRKIVKGVAKNADKAADVSKASEVGKAVSNTAGGASKNADYVADLRNTKAKTRSGHQNAGNKQLHDDMKNDPDLRSEIEGKYGSDAFDRTSPKGGRKNPEGGKWHHNKDKEYDLELKTTDEHKQTHRDEGKRGGWANFWE